MEKRTKSVSNKKVILTLCGFLFVSAALILVFFWACNKVLDAMWSPWAEDQQNKVVRDVVANLLEGNNLMAAYTLRQYKMTYERGVFVGDYRHAIGEIRSRLDRLENTRFDIPYDVFHPDDILTGFFSRGSKRLTGAERELEKQRLCNEYAHAIAQDEGLGLFYRNLLDHAAHDFSILSEKETTEIREKAEEMAQHLVDSNP